MSAIPLIIVAPLVSLQFGLPHSAPLVLAASLSLGIPVLSLLGSIGAALTLGLRGSGVLISLLVLPLYIPALVFGSGAVQATLVSASAGGNIQMLAAILILTLIFAPGAASAALRIALE